MSHKVFRWLVSLILGLAMIAIATVPQAAYAAGSWYVSGGGDDTNDCLSPGTPCATINAAIGKASAGDTIDVASGTYTGTGDEVVLIDRDITLAGGWDSSFATQSDRALIDAQGARRGMTVNAGVTAMIDHFSWQHGNIRAQGGGIRNDGTLTITDSAIDNNHAGAAAGIWNLGTLTISSSTVKENMTTGDGGGILNVGILTLRNSSIVNNTGGVGGGIANGSTGFGLLATANIINSTISGNSAESRGGGIGNPSTGTLALYNSTVSGNHDAFSPGSGGIYNENGNVTLQDSILAGNSNPNSGAMDCSGTIFSAGYNLLGNTSGCSFAADTGDLTDINPHLGQLIGTSSAPAYHPLLSGSPAIDAGNPAGCIDPDNNPLTTDQRGVARVGTCDIGAYEFTTPGPAASLAIVGGDHQSATATLAFPQLLQTAALDGQGSPVSGVLIDFAAPASGASGTFADTSANTTSATTGIDGVATTSIFRANDQQGTYAVSASTTGLAPVNFSLEQFVRPLNDNFASAKAIPSLPFNDSLDSTNATIEPNEPSLCGSTPQTQSVWYSFSSLVDMAVSVDMAGSSFSDANLTVFQSTGPGFGSLQFVRIICGGGSAIFHVQAGTTYYFQAESFSSGGGDLHVNLQAIPPPANDDFANSTLIQALPFNDTVNVSAATTEPGEPASSCAYLGAKYTVWYSFTPATSGSVSAYFPTNHFTSVLSVYTGNSLAGLTQVACHSFGGGDEQLTFRAEAGTTYYFQASSFDGEIGDGSMQLQVWVTPPPVADFFFNPSEPSVFDAISFNDISFDVGNAGFQSFTWNFGDGSTATSSNVNHQYAKDGDYTVLHSVTTVDGRSASTSQVVQVRTHDIGITKVAAPNSASSKQTRTITVAIRNTRYPETVTVDLYKSTPGGDVWIGSLTLQVPVLAGNKTKQFTFNYTFTAQDAQVGKVTFRAVATINGVNDAFPQDNTGISSPPTKVTR